MALFVEFDDDAWIRSTGQILVNLAAVEGAKVITRTRGQDGLRPRYDWHAYRDSHDPSCTAYRRASIGSLAIEAFRDGAMVRLLLLPLRAWSLLWDVFLSLPSLVQAMIATMAISISRAVGGWVGFGVASAFYILGYLSHLVRRAFVKWRSMYRSAADVAGNRSHHKPSSAASGSFSAPSG